MNHLSAKQVKEKMQNGEELNIIDVREAYEAAMGKIPTSINIPLGLMEFKLPELDKNKEYIMVCHSGARSSFACQFLEARGFRVTNMDGGMMFWQGQIV
ncbi:rhodanese-like domain-containing protein [Bacillus tuaregi]|uniref:rhodanese-like domain-containing protein n=1 Tax=Bacillus tuaregi TaxID=1816695 RepID=UPI0008F8F77C|nr:rhodanese-like domain-containing protein [Bacillus tuaregi]